MTRAKMPGSASRTAVSSLRAPRESSVSSSRISIVQRYIWPGGRAPRVLAMLVLAQRGPAGSAGQQPSYGDQLDCPPCAIALLNTRFCSATLACPKSAAEPPYACQVDALNWYRP